MFNEINSEKSLRIDPSKIVASGIEKIGNRYIIWFDGVNGNTYHSGPFDDKVQAKNVLDKYCK